MTGFGVDDGDLVIDSPQNTCRDGDYAVAHMDNRETFIDGRRLHFETNQ